MSFLRAHWVTKAEDEVSWELQEQERAKFYVKETSTFYQVFLSPPDLKFSTQNRRELTSGTARKSVLLNCLPKKNVLFSFLFRINLIPLFTDELWPPRVTPCVWSCKRYTIECFPNGLLPFFKINPFYHPFYHPTHPDSYCWLCSPISFQLTMKFSSAEPLQWNGDSCVPRKWTRWPSSPSPATVRRQRGRQSAQR